MSDYPQFTCVEPRRGLSVQVIKDKPRNRVEIRSITIGGNEQRIYMEEDEVVSLIHSLNAAIAFIRDKRAAEEEARLPVSPDDARKGFAALREQMGRGRE